MTKQQFDNYRFSINTEVKYFDEWSGISEVWFRERLVGLKKTGGFIGYSEIEDIREKDL